MLPREMSELLIGQEHVVTQRDDISNSSCDCAVIRAGDDSCQ